MNPNELKQLVHESIRDSSSKKMNAISADQRLHELLPSEGEIIRFVETVVDKAKVKGLVVRPERVPSHVKTKVRDVIDALDGELPGTTGKLPPP